MTIDSYRFGANYLKHIRTITSSFHLDRRITYIIGILETYCNIALALFSVD